MGGGFPGGGFPGGGMGGGGHPGGGGRGGHGGGSGGAGLYGGDSAVLDINEGKSFCLCPNSHDAVPILMSLPRAAPR